MKHLTKAIGEQLARLLVWRAQNGHRDDAGSICAALMSNACDVSASAGITAAEALAFHLALVSPSEEAAVDMARRQYRKAQDVQRQSEQEEERRGAEVLNRIGR